MNADSLHRLAKVLVDSSEAATIEEALQTFSRYGVRIVLGGGTPSDPGMQIVALTAINCAARSFLGNVAVEASEDFELSAPGFEGTRLSRFLQWLGIDAPAPFVRSSETWPVIQIGDSGKGATPLRTIRPWADGWTFGTGERQHRYSTLFPPACIAAGAFAVSEVFSLLRGDNPYAGRRAVSMSLWSLSTGDGGAPLAAASDVIGSWLVGLGHLGQAYAWTLGFMRPTVGACLHLQDIDVVTPSTLSTSVLSVCKDIGRNKTRVVANWLEARGYRTSIVERRFDQHQKVDAIEPRVALFGVDNPAARRGLERAGFRFVIDAGLGSGYKDFRGIRLRTFPGPSQAAVLWAATSETTNAPDAPAYRALLAQGADPCGVTTLATRAVGAPFVGCVAAALVVAELIRWRAGGPTYSYVDFNLRDPLSLEVADTLAATV